MSLASSPDVGLRPEDNVLKMLYPLPDDGANNSFDEFFERELYNLNRGHDDPQDSLAIIEDYLNDVSDTEESHRSKSSSKRAYSPQPWRKGLWCLHERATPELIVDKTRKTRSQAFVSPSRLTNKESCVITTPPSSSSPKNRPKTLSAVSGAPDLDCNKQMPFPVAREHTLSPTPMYSQITANGEMDLNDVWQHNFQNFHLQPSDDNLYNLPVANEDFTQYNLHVGQINSKAQASYTPNAQLPQSPTRYHYPFQHVSRPDPRLEGSKGREGVSSVTRQQKNLVNTNVNPQINYLANDQNVVPVWTSDSLHSSDSSHYSHSTQYSLDHLPCSYNTVPPQSWMSPTSSQVNTNLSIRTKDIYGNIAAPVPQRATHNILYNQQDFGQQGLGIQYPAANEIGRAIPYEPIDLQRSSLITPPNPFTSYPPLPPSVGNGGNTHHLFSNGLPLESSRRRRHNSGSESPSSPGSPHRASSRSLRQRSPSRPEYTHNRRKSISKPGPIKDPSTSPTHHRSRSTSKPPRTPKTPKTPTSATFGQIDFVNFTPKDSIKLMNDVAPSGSSKTRARREQEAKEKRKRLSEAALQAIKRAGGDVTALDEIILT